MTVANVQQVRNVDFALRAGHLFRNAAHPMQRVYELCGQTNMDVLGVSNREDNSETDPLHIRAVTLPGQKAPSVTCAIATSIQIILFRRPLPYQMQYISLNPISLALGDKGDDGPLTWQGGVEPEDERQEILKKEKSKRLVDKLQKHSVIKRESSPKEHALAKIVSQVNWAWELDRLLQQNASKIGTRPNRSLSMSERVVESASTMKDFVILWVWELFTLYAFPVIRQCFVTCLLGQRMAAEVMLRVLDWRLRPHWAALKDVSATAQQVEIRLQQFCYWPMQYVTLRKRKRDWDSVTTSHPDYIRFYNSLWLVANDIIIGIAIGSYLIDNSDWVADRISTLLTTYTVEALQRSISWLMGWPAGLKLNTELAAFLGDLFLWVIDYWSSKNPAGVVSGWR
jgi:phosphatidylinositol N-acetylglucosaminyltransferase subunit Q